jgi:hypothetical protein
MIRRKILCRSSPRLKCATEFQYRVSTRNRSSVVGRWVQGTFLTRFILLCLDNVIKILYLIADDAQSLAVFPRAISKFSLEQFSYFEISICFSKLPLPFSCFLQCLLSAKLNATAFVRVRPQLHLHVRVLGRQRAQSCKCTR